VADTVRGRTEYAPSPYYPEPILSVPLADVIQVEDYHGDAAKTVGLILIIFAGCMLATAASLPGSE